MKKSLLKGTLLLSSMFLLAACQTDEKVKEVESNADAKVESVKEEADAEVESEKEKLDEVKEEADKEVESAKEEEKEEVDSAKEESKAEKEAEKEKEKESKEAEKEKEKESKEAEKEKEKESKEAEKESKEAEKAEEKADKAEEKAEKEKEKADEKSEEAESLKEEAEEDAEKVEEAEAIVLPAYDPKAELQDGEYTVIGETDEDGYARKFTIKVKDGEIKEAIYDIVDEENTILGLDKDFLKTFEEKHSLKFEDLKKEYEAVLREKKDPEAKLELGSKEDKDFFKRAAEVLLTLAQEGKEEEVHLENVTFE